MSANKLNPVAYPYSWLQPVRYHPDEYRQFVSALDAGLADLLAKHASKSSRPVDRSANVELDREGLLESEPQLPPGTAN